MGIFTDILDKRNKPKRGLVDGPGSYSQEKVPSPYLNDKKFLKFLNENYPNQPRDKLNTAYEAYERMLLNKNKIIGTKGLMEALGANNPYSKDAIDRALGNVGDRTIKKNMSSNEKSKIKQANKLRKIIVDTIGEPKSYADEMKKYRYLKKQAERYDLKPVKGQGFKKYFELDNKKIKALNKALNENYRKVGLRANTIDNIYNLFDDKEFMKSLKSYKGGEVDLDSALFKKVFKPGLAGERSYAYMMLGRALRGEIELEGIKKNKALGNKIIKSIASDKNLTKFGQMDKAALRWAKFQMAKHFDDPKASYDTITQTISKAFRDAGINKKLGYTLVTDEIFPARTGQLTIKGSGAYNQFVQFIDKSINEGAKRSFDGKASTRYQEIIKARKEGNFTRVEDLVKAHKKAVKDFYINNPEAKGKVKLTQLDYNPKTKKFAPPTEIYGTDLPPKILSDMEKFYRKTGLSFDVGSTMTLEKAPTNIKKTIDQLNIKTPKKFEVAVQRLGCQGSKVRIKKVVGGSINTKTCYDKGLEKLRNKQITNPIDAKNMKEIAKASTMIARTGGAAKVAAILGPAGIGLDLLFEGAVVGNEYLKGKPFEEAWGRSFLSYLGPNRQDPDKLEMDRSAGNDPKAQSYVEDVRLENEFYKNYNQYKAMEADDIAYTRDDVLAQMEKTQAIYDKMANKYEDTADPKTDTLAQISEQTGSDGNISILEKDTNYRAFERGQERELGKEGERSVNTTLFGVPINLMTPMKSESLRKQKITDVFENRELVGQKIRPQIKAQGMLDYDLLRSGAIPGIGYMAEGGLANLTRTTPPKRSLNKDSQGLASLPEYDR